MCMHITFLAWLDMSLHGFLWLASQTWPFPPVTYLVAGLAGSHWGVRTKARCPLLPRTASEHLLQGRVALLPQAHGV